MRVSSFASMVMEAVVMTGFILSLLAISDAQVRSSTSYRLESDSINFAGGLSSSSNYTLESTAGEIATGPSDSATYSLRAGYQQMQSVFISMTDPGNVELTPSIGGLTGGTASGSLAVMVLTDSPSGYELTISAENAPAMRKGSDVIDDYVPVASPNPDYSFITGSTDVFFGFSPAGADVINRYRNDTAVCAAGSLSTAQTCWDGLTTTPQAIARGSSNQPSGATTTVYFRVGIGGNAAVPPGEYVATTTLTALPL
jgi:hypothetical protein